MSQDDMNVANSDGATVRADINSQLGALVTNSSGATAPSTTFAFQTWADTANDLLKIRNAGNSAWINVYKLSTGGPEQGADIVSASALPVLADGLFNDVTGTTGITSINTLGVGVMKILQFDAAVTLTHHATNLVLPAGVNITTVAGQVLTFYEYAAGDWRLVSSSLPTAGKQTIPIPASSMRPTVSNGAAAITDAETTAGRPDITAFAFDASADEAVQFQIPMPKSWDLGTLTFDVQWASTATDTDGVAWALQLLYVPDNSTIDAAYGTAVVVTDDAQGAAEEQYQTAESAAVTAAGSPAAGGMLYGRLFRDVSDANDDMTEDALLQAIKLHITTKAENDT